MGQLLVAFQTVNYWLDRIQRIIFWPVLALFLTFVVVAFGLPNSYWIDIKHLTISDAVVGTPPKITLIRDVRQKFRVRRDTVVRRTDIKGELTDVCTSTRVGDIEPGSLSPDFDLDQWFGPELCRLTPGTYLFMVSWSWDVLGVERVVGVTSNAFAVYAPTTAPAQLK